MPRAWNNAANLAALCAALAACHSAAKDTTLHNSADAMIPKVDPSLCDTAGKNVVTFDLNHDNKPDLWRLYKTEDEGGTKVEFMTCKQADFDHDGRKDWVVALDRKGTRLYEEADLDFDGKWDLFKTFDPKTGLVSEVERDTDFDGKFDEQEIYDSAGQLSSIRRDRNGDGKPDVWEQYRDGQLIEILYDDNFDGKVDRKEEVPGAHPKVQMPATQDISDPNAGSAAAGSATTGSAAPTK